MSGVSPEVVQAERSFSLSVCVRQLHYSPAASKESLSEHIALQVCKASWFLGGVGFSALKIGLWNGRKSLITYHLDSADGVVPFTKENDIICSTVVPLLRYLGYLMALLA